MLCCKHTDYCKIIICFWETESFFFKLNIYIICIYIKEILKKENNRKVFLSYNNSMHSDLSGVNNELKWWDQKIHVKIKHMHGRTIYNKINIGFKTLGK